MLRQTQFVPPVPFLVARRLGLIGTDAVDIRTTDTRSSEEQLAQLLSGEQDLAVTALDNLFSWNARGADARAIAQIERTTPLSVFAGGDVAELAELAGRRFGVDAAGNGFALAARYLFRHAGVEVDLVEVGGVRERWEALSAGAIDATLLGPPFDAFAVQAGLVRLASIGDLIASYPGQVLVARRDVIAERRSELHDYLTALGAAVAHAETISEEQGSALLQSSGFPEHAATTMWQERPRALRPDPTGVAAVATVRAELDGLPSGFADPAGVYELLTEDV